MAVPRNEIRFREEADFLFHRRDHGAVVETHENWLEAHRCLNMNDLREHKKTHLRKAA